MLNDTHLPDLRSWIESANDGVTDFPVQNLPYGVFRRRGRDESWRVGVAIGTMILDVDAVHRLGFVDGAAAAAATTCASPSLNGLMSLGPDAWAALRRALSRLLRDDTPTGRMAKDRAPVLLVAQEDAELHLPAKIGDYTDFYASVYHATNVGAMFRPDQPLLPNYKWIPIGYHGRASSLVVSGTPVARPTGQSGGSADVAPTVAPTARLDYEAELGLFVGPGNSMGEPIDIGDANRHLFGIALLNDWSARDLQAWEYQPLGPFLAKSFATSLSPWVVTLEALAPYRRPAFARPAGDPAPLPYLSDAGDQSHGGLDITIEVWLRTAHMRDAGEPSVRLSSGNAQDLYWTMAQLLTHHASAGCNLQPGDLLGSGTISGAARESRGCLLELTWRGSEPVTLPNGEVRAFLEDGDEVTLRGGCVSRGAPAHRLRGVHRRGAPRVPLPPSDARSSNHAGRLYRLGAASRGALLAGHRAQRRRVRRGTTPDRSGEQRAHRRDDGTADRTNASQRRGSTRRVRERPRSRAADDDLRERHRGVGSGEYDLRAHHGRPQARARRRSGQGPALRLSDRDPGDRRR